jgi:hypothetical protein
MPNLGMGEILCLLNFSQQDNFFKTQDVDHVKDKDGSYSYN